MLIFLLSAPLLLIFVVVFKLLETQGVRGTILMTGTALSVLRVACFLLGIYLYQSSGGSGAFIGLFLGFQGVLELGLLLGPQGKYGLSWLAVGCVVITGGSFLLVSICAAIAALVQRVVPRRRVI